MRTPTQCGRCSVSPKSLPRGSLRLAECTRETHEEEWHRHLHRRCDAPHDARADTARSGLVNLDLLGLDAKLVAKLLLGQSGQAPALT